MNRPDYSDVADILKPNIYKESLKISDITYLVTRDCLGFYIYEGDVPNDNKNENKNML